MVARPRLSPGCAHAAAFVLSVALARPVEPADYAAAAAATDTPLLVVGPPQQLEAAAAAAVAPVGGGGAEGGSGLAEDLGEGVAACCAACLRMLAGRFAGESGLLRAAVVGAVEAAGRGAVLLCELGVDASEQ
jgi:hypothetical protein